ncbi:hypothetical protein RCS94_04625 [Orbaceae bacterium ac157xtp]
MLIVPPSYGALSATSANTIKGRAPTVQNSSLGFNVNGDNYSKAIGNIDPNVAKAFNAGLSLSHFTAMDLTNADYYDADGDVARSTAPLTVGTKSIKWYKSDGTEITDLNQQLGCGNNLGSVLTLKIKMQNIQMHSEHGDPRDNSLTVLEQSYKIAGTQGICYAKPGSLKWYSYNGISTTRDSIEGGGYTADFVPNKGFKANPTVSNKKFPTTAFPKARFQLVMTGSQTDYNYNVTTNPNSSASVDTNGWVTINNKPTGPITVRVTSKSSSSTYFDYTFNPISLWVVPKLNPAANSYDRYTYAEAKSSSGCGVESKIPIREQLTNSPLSRLPAGGSFDSNSYTRAIGKLDIGGGAQPMKESIFSEWGETTRSTYPGSQWTTYGAPYYWTREAYSSSYQFLVRSLDGHVSWDYTIGSCYVACLE